MDLEHECKSLIVKYHPSDLSCHRVDTLSKIEFSQRIYPWEYIPRKHKTVLKVCKSFTLWCRGVTSRHDQKPPQNLIMLILESGKSSLPAPASLLRPSLRDHLRHGAEGGLQTIFHRTSTVPYRAPAPENSTSVRPLRH